MGILHELIDLLMPVKYQIYDSIAQLTVSIISNYKGIDLMKIFQCLSKFPQRDIIEVKFKFSVDDVITINNSNAKSEEELKDSIQEIHDIFLNQDIDITINISKSFSEMCSIYCLEKFFEWLLTKQLKEIMKEFSDIYNKSNNNIKFICYDFDGLFATKTMSFVKPDYDLKNDYNEINRNEIISNSRKICNFYNHSQYNIIPDDFYILVSSNVDSSIIDVFNNINIILSLIYLADVSDFDGNVINITIKGYRAIDHRIELNKYKYKDNHKILYEIYRWIYGGGNIYDKSQLARNILTLHCKYSSILELDEKTLASINSNYGLYLKENVNNYLNIKKDITSFLQANIQEISKAINNFASDLKKNFFAFFSYFVTIIISSSIAKLKLIDIFSPEVTTITSIILVGSLIFLSVSLFEVISKYKMINNSMENLKDSYNDILDNVELQSIIEKVKNIKPNTIRFRNNLIFISAIWIVMVIGMFLILDYVSGSNPLLFIVNLFK